MVYRTNKRKKQKKIETDMDQQFQLLLATASTEKDRTIFETKKQDEILTRIERLKKKRDQKS